ncbi:MAG: hypothetical protein IIZ44_05990, partial [Muribaculaceae bacterium]|nr:hypothetical protein [Muribaculaceae bacterium]
MYNINQLNEMSDEQLRDLAKSMGIKRVDSIDHDDLVYQVLDQQAETEAANASEPVKRRRERIRQPAAKANGNEVTKDDAVATKTNKNNQKKTKAEEAPKAEDTPKEVKPAIPAEEQPAEAEPPKRKRGRPSAAEKAAREAALIEAQANDQQDVAKDADGETDAQKEVMTAEQPARRRGRKPKQTIAEPVLPF